MTSNERLDAAFAALADPTRRAILSRLRGGECTAGELARPFPISPPAVSKHLRVLERAGLIRQRREAQFRVFRLEPAPLKAVSDWTGHYRQLWEARLDRLESYVQEMKTQQKEKKHARKQPGQSRHL